eukprot:4411228-Amphidinium_carterae.1
MTSKAQPTTSDCACPKESATSTTRVTNLRCAIQLNCSLGVQISSFLCFMMVTYPFLERGRRKIATLGNHFSTCACAGAPRASNTEELRLELLGELWHIARDGHMS